MVRIKLRQGRISHIWKNFQSEKCHDGRGMPLKACSLWDDKMKISILCKSSRKMQWLVVRLNVRNADGGS